MELIRLQQKEVHDVILRALQNNEYFPHSENIHVGMIEDNRRQFGITWVVEHTLAATDRCSSYSRLLHAPKLNWEVRSLERARYENRRSSMPPFE